MATNPVCRQQTTERRERIVEQNKVYRETVRKRNGTKGMKGIGLRNLENLGEGRRGKKLGGKKTPNVVRGKRGEGGEGERRAELLKSKRMVGKGGGK